MHNLRMARLVTDSAIIEVILEAEERISLLQMQLAALLPDHEDYASNRRSPQQAIAELRTVIESNIPPMQ